MAHGEMTSEAIKQSLRRHLYHHLADAVSIISVPADGGAVHFPEGTEVSVQGGNIVQIRVPGPGGPRYFEVSVKERF